MNQMGFIRSSFSSMDKSTIVNIIFSNICYIFKDKTKKVKLLYCETLTKLQNLITLTYLLYFGRTFFHCG